MFKFLCLHGAGTSAEILRTQIGAIQAALGEKAGIQFEFLEGEYECEPGPGVQGYYDGPFYALYDWSLTSTERHTPSIEDAYDLIYEMIEAEGPFDGILGFSQGSATAYGFLAHHAKYSPLQPAFRCAVFFNGLPPFKRDGDGHVIYDMLDHSTSLSVPSLHVIGRRDFVRPHSLVLLKMLDPLSSTLYEHDKGHEIPRDSQNTTQICSMIENLCQRAAW